VFKYVNCQGKLLLPLSGNLLKQHSNSIYFSALSNICVPALQNFSIGKLSSQELQRPKCTGA